MAKYYQDFVGLNTFIYEVAGWDPDQIQALGASAEYYNYNGTAVTRTPYQNTFGQDYSDTQEQESLIRNKNYVFITGPQSADLSNTASYFPALMLHRNGPYGYPMWKQTRVGQNPLTRRQIKENILTIVQEPGNQFSFTRNNKFITQKARYGSILKYNETPIVSRYNPVVVFGKTIINEKVDDLIIRAPLGNNLVQFNNYQLNEELGLVDLKSDVYEKTKQLYLDRALLKNDSPLDVFELLLYKETVYPPQLYTYKNYVRQRTTFSFPWRDDRTDRIPSSAVDNGFGSEPRQSIWIMDAYRGFDTAGLLASAKGTAAGYLANRFNSVYVDNGILQNQYSFGNNNLADSSSFSLLDEILRPAPIYNRKHVLTPLSSAVNFNGMNIEGVNSGSLFADISTSSLPAGEAKWEAGSQSGKNPFYDSYNDYIQGPRQLGKDYSIIPEFKISNHVGFYETNSVIKENLNIFEITGGLSNTTGSNENNFYEIYSNSDFMKNFEMVVNDNKEVGEPLHITLNCKAIKKLLPYEGFYPQQRTVQIAQQFFNSYSASLALSGAAQSYGTTPAKIGFQNALAPLFAPGILFNSIKSGVAVDYPMISGQLGLDKATNKMVLNQGNDYYCSFSGSEAIIGALTASYIINDGLIFDRRISFETIIRPETLQGIELFCNEPDTIANHSSSATLNGTAGDRLYSLMMHNFLAETSNFFLQNKNYTTFFSKPSNELKQFEAGKDYMMRVKMFKTTDDAQLSNVSGGIGDKYFTAPQYSTGSRENFTMYSRPTAFGPPTLMSSSYDYVSYSAGLGWLGGDPYIGNRSDRGENYPFTPPYYHGQAWADIKFTPTSTGTYTAKDIEASASITYYRYVDPNTDTGENIFDIPVGVSKGGGHAYVQNNFYNKNALQLSASVNLLSIERDQAGDLNEETARLVIQSKWESPMLNFAHLSASDSVTLPNNASQSVPRGMWHQYGRIEEEQSKGVFLQIEDIDENWLTNILDKNTSNVLSLADQLDLSTQPKRMGEIADSKVIREAIVAVPFVEQEGIRKYFHIPRSDIDNALTTQDASGQSVAQMVEKMRKYVFPPNMDFLSNEEIEPFAMYIFEFEHTLDKQDLADIWQGLYPEITSRFETSTSTISHPLLAHELLGGGASIVKTRRFEALDTGDQGNKLPTKIRWMVFKVKQKGTGNYWRTVIGTEGEKLSEVPNLTFNWPYDFFSLVELAKIDSSVAIGRFEGGPVKRIVQPQGQVEEAFKIKKYETTTLTTEAQTSLAQGVGSAQAAPTAVRTVSDPAGLGQLAPPTSTGLLYRSDRTYTCAELKEIARTQGTGDFSTDHKLQYRQCIRS